MKRWFVVQTKPGQENIAAANLGRQDFHTYLPRLKTRRRIGGRMIDSAASLFPGYLFVMIDTSCDRWRSINATYGAIGLVCFGGRPAPLDHTIIESIKNREESDGLIHEATLTSLKQGDRVAMTEGPLEEAPALFQRQDASGRVVVLMSLLGRTVPVRLAEERVRVVS